MNEAADLDMDLVEELELDESLDEPIYCESLWCKAHGKNPHYADWYWLAPCRQGTMAVCEHRRVALVAKPTSYYCDPGCRGYHSADETDWAPVK